MTEIQVTVTEKLRLDTSGRVEFNSTYSELPRAATAPESSSTVMKLQRLNNNKLVASGGCGWSEMKCGDVRSKTRLETNQIAANRGGNSAIVDDFDRCLYGCFPVAMMTKK